MVDDSNNVVVPLIRKYDKRTNVEKYTISKKQYIKDKAHLSQFQDKTITKVLSYKEILKTSKPTIIGKEVKIDKNTYDILNNFMNTSKRVIKDMARNQAYLKTSYSSCNETTIPF